MHYRLRLKINLLWLLLLMPFMRELHCFPTITQQHQQNANFLQNFDKNFPQSPHIEETIEEVQKILAQDPTLPRLTR